MLNGRLYDGTTGHPHEVSAEAVGGRLVLSQTGGWSQEVDGALLRRADSGADELRLARSDRPGWRLILPVEAESTFTSMLGRHERYGRWIDRFGLVPALIVGGVVTASVVAIGYLAPHWIAPHVPMSWERNVGSAIVGDFGSWRCRDPRGQAALASLVEKVAPGATRGPDAIKVAALNVPIFNAAALPGGYIVVFKPAITQTNGDALAGILGHEVAHVRRRHVAEALIRELGIGALIRMFAGNLGANAEQLVSLSYTRDNEAQADADAIAMLRQAKISPRPTAQLFARLAADRDGLSNSAEFLQSHPLSAKRAKRFANSFDPRATYSPAVSPEQWQALLHMCGKGTK